MCGCHSFGPLVKRESEENCPTDIRKTVPWCYGEDAIFQCPCGPSTDYYGHKPTCWRTWPAPATVWRDSYCAGGCQCPPGSTTSSGAPDLMILPPTDETIAPGATQEGGSPTPMTIEPLPPTSRVLNPAKKSGRAIRTQANSRSPRATVAAAGNRELSQVGGLQRAAPAPVAVEQAAYASEGGNSAKSLQVSQVSYANPASNVSAEAASDANSTLSVVTLPPVAEQAIEQRPKRPRRTFPWLRASHGDKNGSESMASPQNSEFVR
jgi:hypothetical protein